MMEERGADPRLRRTVATVAGLNLAYFAVEFMVALAVGSVALFADSVDFLEDASVNLLILLALAWTARNRARLGMVLAAVLLAPGIATVWTAIRKLASPETAPNPVALAATAVGALAVNLSCALMLARFHRRSGSLTRAAFLSARNDAVVNVAIIGAGLVTAMAWRTAWPDLIVGIGIAIMNVTAAREVWNAAREEHRAAR